ncbi:MAG: PAS domain S-box protein [Maribacter litoralis]|uniref:PAS domain S-box protein n=1 Tax=Maribacter litoralis TaxID=2059726 RepID=UPI003298CB85
MFAPEKRSILKSPLFYGLLLFFLVLIITQFIAYQKYQLDRKSDQREIEQRVSQLKVDLQNVLGQSYNATHTLAFIVDQYGIPQNFDSVAQLLLNSNKSIDALELVDKKGLITHVYPLKGNKVIGLNIFDDPDNKMGATTTLEKGDYYTAGPIYLRQGGSGIIGRKPMFKNGEFNGFVAAVVRLSTVLNAIQLDTLGESKFSYELVKINLDETEETFYASKNISKEGATTLPLTTSQGEWKLYVYSNNNKYNSASTIFSILGLLLAIVCGTLSWFLMRQPSKLNRLVDEKTALLKESQERYKMLIEEASDGIFLSDFKGNILDANPFALQMFEYSKQELLNKNITELIFSEDQLNLHKNFTKAVEGESMRVERKMIKKDGTIFYGEVSGKKLSNSTIIGIVRDVTQRIKLELSVQENLVKFSKAYNNGFVGMVIKDQNKRFIDANCYFLDLIGYSLEEIKGKTMHELGLIDMVEVVKKNPKLNAFINSDRVDKIEIELTTKNGQKLHLITSNEPYEYLGEKLCLSTYIDQTKSKNASIAIEKSEKRHRQFTERISDAYVSFDNNWCFTVINAKAAKIIGINAKEMIGKNVWDEFPSFKNSEAYAIYKGAVSRQVYTHFEQYHEEVDRWIENHLYPSSNGISIFFKDITYRKKADEEKQRLISVMENSPGFIGLATLEGKPLFLNDAGKKLVNLPENFDPKSTTIFDFFEDDYKDVIVNEHMPSIMEKGLWTGEVPLKNFKTNIPTPLEFSGFLIKDEKTNKPIAIGAIGFDLTERKKTQKEILALQSKMDAAIRIGKIGYWDYDMDSKTYICSPLIYHIYNIEPDTVIDIPFLESLIHPDDLEMHRQNVMLILKEKTTHAFSYRIIVKDGSVKYLMVEIEVDRNDDNRAINIRGTIIDITKQKEADFEILDLKNKMEDAIRIGKIGYWDYDFQTQQITWSPRMYEIYDVKPETNITIPLIEGLLHPDDVELHRSVVENEKSQSFSYRIFHKDGSLKYLFIQMEVELDKKESPIKFRGTVIDITEQKEAEKAILDLQNRMNAAIRIGNIGYWHWDMTSDVVEWSKEMYAIHEIDPSTKMTVDLVRKTIYHEDLPIMDKALSSKPGEKRPTPSIYRSQLKDGTFKYFLASSELVFDENEVPIVYRGTAMDITKTVLAEEALKESQEKFAKAFENKFVGMLILDESEIVIEANATVCNILNVSKEKLINKKIMESGVVFLNDHYTEKRHNTLTQLEEQGKVTNEEFKISLTNGQEKTVLVSKEYLEIKDQKRVLVTINDDTKRKETAEKLATQFIELQKTNSELDSFVYSASHELRAPLSSVLGLIQLIKMEGVDPKLYQHIDMMEISIERLDSFIKDIIEYSRNKHKNIELEPINFSNLIEQSLESFWYLENTKKIKIDISIDDKVQFVSDSKRVSVLLNNFISNAIKYHDVTKKSPFIWISVKTSKKEAILVVKDNGVGIDEDQIKRIFEMFYRVSSKVMGSGIGLFIVKEVISRLKGTVTLKSKIGKGSTFTITIPNESGKLYYEQGY